MKAKMSCRTIWLQSKSIQKKFFGLEKIDACLLTSIYWKETIYIRDNLYQNKGISVNTPYLVGNISLQKRVLVQL